MPRHLPSFEGNEVTEAKTTVAGKVTEPEVQPYGPLRLKDTVVTIDFWEIKDIQHPTDKEGAVTRVRKLSLLECHQIPAEEAEELLNAARKRTEEELG